MNNKEQPSMQSISSLVKFLVYAWRRSKCPYPGVTVDAPTVTCTKCKYNVLCSKIDELARVVGE